MLIEYMNNKGQTLIEALVALGAAAVIMSAIIVVVIGALNNSDFTTSQNLATNYAQAGLEKIRQLSETNWINFSSLSGTYCLDQKDNLSKASSTGCSNGSSFSPFIRKADIIQNSTVCNPTGHTPGVTYVSVIVSWSDSKCTNSPYCHNVALDSCISNLNANVAVP